MNRGIEFPERYICRSFGTTWKTTPWLSGKGRCFPSGVPSSAPSPSRRSDELRAVLVKKILQAPDVGEPLQVVIGALSEFDWENLGSRNSQRQRQAVIAANPELLERDLIKNHSIAVGFIDALRQRGVDADIARLAAHVGIQLFITAYVHWLEAGAKGDLAIMSESVVSLLASIVPANAQPPSSRQKSTRVPANQADPSPRRGRGPHDSRRGHRR